VVSVDLLHVPRHILIREKWSVFGIVGVPAGRPCVVFGLTRPSAVLDPILLVAVQADERALPGGPARRGVIDPTSSIWVALAARAVGLILARLALAVPADASHCVIRIPGILVVAARNTVFTAIIVVAAVRNLAGIDDGVPVGPHAFVFCGLANLRFEAV
jgi:hypothetical protein